MRKLCIENLGIRGFFCPQFCDVYNLANFIIKLAKLVIYTRWGKKIIPIVLVGKRQNLSQKEKMIVRLCMGVVNRKRKEKEKETEKRERIYITTGDLNLVTRFSKSEVRSLLRRFRVSPVELVTTGLCLVTLLVSGNTSCNALYCFWAADWASSFFRRLNRAFSEFLVYILGIF